MSPQDKEHVMKRINMTACVVLALSAGTAAGDGFEIENFTLQGGRASSGTTFSLVGTIGQPEAGDRIASASFDFDGGFWPCATAPPSCTGDVDGDFEVGFTDLVAVLSAWGPCGTCAADVDDSGAVDFTDLVLVLSGWGACR